MSSRRCRRALDEERVQSRKSGNPDTPLVVTFRVHDRITSAVADGKIREAIRAADERIVRLSERCLVFTKANGELDEKKNLEWQNFLEEQERLVPKLDEGNVLSVLASAAVSVEKAGLLRTLARGAYEKKRKRESSADAARDYIARMQKVHRLGDDTIRSFARYLRAFQTNQISKQTVVDAVQTLLKGCPDLIDDFYKFLPPDRPPKDHALGWIIPGATMTVSQSTANKLHALFAYHPL